MSKPWVTHASQEFAEKYIPGKDTVCISISERESVKLSDNFEDILRLFFFDVEDNRHGYTPINPSQAKRIAEFLTEHRGKHIFVHCAAGISRSGAVAEVVLEAFPEYQDKGWSLSGEPMRHPNNTVKRLVKRALGLVPIGGENEEGKP